MLNQQEVSQESLLQIIVKAIRFVQSHKKQISLYFIVGLGLGLGYFYQAKPIYRSQMTAYSNNLNKEQVTDVMQDLSRLFSENDYIQLKQKMHLSETVLKKVAGLECKPHLTLESLKPSEQKEDEQIFTITADVKDIGILDSLELGIIHYLEENTYVKTRVDLGIHGMKIEAEKVQKEIEDLEAIKLGMKNLINEGSNKSNFFLSDQGGISSQIMTLFRRMTDLKYDLQFVDKDIRVIKSFTKFKKKTSPSFSLSILGGLIFSFSIYFTLFFIRKIRVLL